MNMSLMQIVAAIAMVSITVTLVFAYRKYLATNSKRRMVTMLAAVGFEYELVPSGDRAILMKEARERCRSCACEDVCERWLRGDRKSSNTFCPNSTVFEALARYSRSGG
jgi:hypothetical protein